MSAVFFAYGPLRIPLPRSLGRIYGTWLEANAFSDARSGATRSLKERCEGFSGLARRVLDNHGVVMEVRGPRPRPGSMIACNHLSYLDPLIVVAQCPSVPVAKSEVESWPVIGAAGRDAGVLFNERSNIHQGASVLRGMRRAIEVGVSVLNFPEGTTSFGETLLPFKRGMFGVARITCAPVVPTVLRFDDVKMCWVGDMGFVPHYLDLIRRPVTKGVIVHGDPIDSREFDSAEALSAATAAAMYALRTEHFGI